MERQIKMGFGPVPRKACHKRWKRCKAEADDICRNQAVSLFVAALGITNTMIICPFRRTRKSGVMSSGCLLEDIRLFLMEAGCYPGFASGLAGVVLSFGISALMNLAA